MLVLHPAQSPRKIRRPPCIGLAAAGGGPLGGMYKLSALRALDEVIADIDMTALDVYVGVSSAH